MAHGVFVVVVAVDIVAADYAAPELVATHQPIFMFLITVLYFNVYS